MYDVEKYAKYALHQRANGFKIFAEHHSLIAEIPVGGRVLDIGCGPGTVTQLLTHFTNLGEIIGTDVNPKMIEEAKRKYSDSRMSFRVWDVQKSEKFCEKFDLVTANAVMHLITDQKAALKNVFQILKPGGFFLAHILARPSAVRKFEEKKWEPFVKEVKK